MQILLQPDDSAGINTQHGCCYPATVAATEVAVVTVAPASSKAVSPATAQSTAAPLAANHRQQQINTSSSFASINQLRQKQLH
jgi:hypothetical protein